MNESDIEGLVSHVIDSYKFDGLPEGLQEKCRSVYRKYVVGKNEHSLDRRKFRNVITAARNDWRFLKDASDHPEFCRFLADLDGWTWNDHENLKYGQNH